MSAVVAAVKAVYAARDAASYIDPAYIANAFAGFVATTAASQSTYVLVV